MKNKGFTLIELLAVIVILAIIALIAVPIVLNIIKDSKENATIRSAELYLDAVNMAIARNSMTTAFPSGETECGINPDGNLLCSEVGSDPIPVDINGDVPTGGQIKFSNGKIVKDSETYLIMSDGKKYSYTDGKLGVSNGSSNNGGGQSEDTYAYLTYTGSNVPGPGIGEDASSLSTSAPTDKNYYLKYKLDDNNLVTNSYACVKFAGTEYCLEGGSNDTYGWDTDEAHSTGRVQALYEIQQASISGVSCDFGSGISGCSDGSVDLFANSSGIVYAYVDFGNCYVVGDGSSYCGR